MQLTLVGPHTHYSTEDATSVLYLGGGSKEIIITEQLGLLKTINEL